jgi:heme-degrading monooxygenase HmoA
MSATALSSTGSRSTEALPPGAVVTVFRSRLRPGAEPEYQPLAQGMEALARAMPGFVDFKTFTSADGERLSVVVFADADTHDAWRDHPGHREAQRTGRDRLYSSYHIAVCTVTAERRFDAPQA